MWFGYPKRFLIATILNKSGEKQQRRFDRNDDGILALKKWVVLEECDVVARKSTSDFWVPIYDSFIKHIPVLVGNTRDVKAFTHKKTDNVDSEFIAQLALNCMVKASGVFPQDHRQFRLYVRLRHKLIQKRTYLKNEAHSILTPEMFNLNDVLADILGKNGRMILSGIISGKTVDEIIENLSPNVRKKSF